MEKPNWTGPLPVLSEDVKTFVDDMYDYDIVAISKRKFAPSLYWARWMNRHRITMDIPEMLMNEVSYYCKYLIAIGAVKLEEPQPLKPISSLPSDTAS